MSPNGGRYDVSLRHLLTGQGLVLACSQVVVENGTYPITDVFDELRPLSANDGRTELSSLTGPAPLRPRPDNGFELYRIGDAVTSRSVHAAMLDAVRLCIQF